jgi:hypothetical protein
LISIHEAWIIIRNAWIIIHEAWIIIHEAWIIIHEASIIVRNPSTIVRDDYPRVTASDREAVSKARRFSQNRDAPDPSAGKIATLIRKL